MPTVTRKIIDGPSREELFDALRLHAEDRTVTFEVEQPIIRPLSPGDRTEKTQEELLVIAFGAMPHFAITVDFIKAIGSQGEDWLVSGKLAPNRHLDEFRFRVMATFNTKRRRESGDLEVSWETSELGSA